MTRSTNSWTEQRAITQTVSEFIDSLVRRHGRSASAGAGHTFTLPRSRVTRYRRDVTNTHFTDSCTRILSTRLSVCLSICLSVCLLKGFSHSVALTGCYWRQPVEQGARSRDTSQLLQIITIATWRMPTKSAHQLMHSVLLCHMYMTHKLCVIYIYIYAWIKLSDDT